MTLTVKIIAPDRTVWATEAEEVILPSSTGQVGILTGHAPLVSSLDTGVLRVKTSGKWVALAIMGGFAEVGNNNLTILVIAAEQGSTIDKDKAQSEYDNANLLSEKAKTPKEILQTRKNIEKARARLQAATFSAA